MLVLSVHGTAGRGSPERTNEALTSTSNSTKHCLTDPSNNSKTETVQKALTVTFGVGLLTL
eukprot:1335287-Rhodomonas_salina.2